MENKKIVYKSVDDYIASFPEGVQKILEELRSVIHAAAPDATEKISYQMPAFTLNGPLVYFAAFKSHIGFYPTASGIAAFEKELAVFDTSKGTVRFPTDQPLPFDLIRKIVKFRVEKNLRKPNR